MADPGRPPKDTIGLGTFSERRDWNIFAEAYGDPESGVAAGKVASNEEPKMGMSLPVCTAA